MKLRLNKIDLLCYIVFLLILFNGQYTKFDITIGQIGAKLVNYFGWIGAIVLFVYSLTKKRTKDGNNNVYAYIKIILPLFLLILLVEIIVNVFGSFAINTYGLAYWTRFISNLIGKVSVFVIVIALYNLKGSKAIDLISNILILNGTFLVLYDVIKNGFLNTFATFLLPLKLVEETSATQFLEVHELTFSIGLLLIYYLFFSEKKDKTRIFLLLIIFWLGNKRIGFGGIAVAFLFTLFVKKKGMSKSNIFIIGLAGVFICLMYDYLCYDGKAMQTLQSIGINVMGRDKIFRYFINRTQFSLSYTGWGVSAVSRAIEHMTQAEAENMINVRGLHNDILKIYIDYGFIGSILWYYLNLINIPKNLYSIFGKKTATLYMSLVIYAFITYLTDNTESYFIFQTILFLIPLVAGDKAKTNDEIRKEKQDLRP